MIRMDRRVLFLMATAAVFVPLSTGVENVVVGNSSIGNASFRPECTTVNGTDLVSCLPTFIIAGTQKSGTTVLAALLSGHPMVRFSRRKETHFFDRKGPKDAASYLKLFPPWDSNSRRLDRLPIYGEATPSYISSRNSCKHIAEIVPNVKLIILVREPVARAYSEYQMKSRRVAHQKEFISLLMTNKKRIIRCMAKHPADYPAITQCVPSNVSQHSRWAKLITAWKKSIIKLETWTQVVEGCFPHHQSSLTRSLFGKKKRKYRPAFRKNHTSPQFTQELHYNSSQKATFDPVSCWRHYPQGFETIKLLRAAMMDEIDAFQACRSSVPSADLLGHNISSIESRLEHLDRVVDQCLRVRGGISSQYFYRSMYAVQLHHCFQHIPREQFLVIPSERLRTDTATVYAEVLSFLGLFGSLQHQQEGFFHNETQADAAGNTVDPPYLTNTRIDAAAAALEPEQIARAAVDKHFPNFARSTGWSLQSEYAPIPPDIQQHMQAFFYEQNELLFELLQQNLTTMW